MKIRKEIELASSTHRLGRSSGGISEDTKKGESEGATHFLERVSRGTSEDTERKRARSTHFLASDREGQVRTKKQ